MSYEKKYAIIRDYGYGSAQYPYGPRYGFRLNCHEIEPQFEPIKLRGVGNEPLYLVFADGKWFEYFTGKELQVLSSNATDLSIIDSLTAFSSCIGYSEPKDFANQLNNYSNADIASINTQINQLFINAKVWTVNYQNAVNQAAQERNKANISAEVELSRGFGQGGCKNDSTISAARRGCLSSLIMPIIIFGALIYTVISFI